MCSGRKMPKKRREKIELSQLFKENSRQIEKRLLFCSDRFWDPVSIGSM
jgi:hypothetical protein